MHEAFERNDGPVRAGYLLIGTLVLDGAAANVVCAQGASPGEIVDSARRKLPPTDQHRGTELLEERLATVDAYLRAIARHEEVLRVVASAPHRATATEHLSALLGVSPELAEAVSDMPLDMTSHGGREALQAEREDLARRLFSIR